MRAAWVAGRMRAAVAALVGVTLVLACVAVGCARSPVATASAAGCGPGWVTGWLAAQQPVPGDQLAGRTLRLRVHVDAPGGLVRLRLSNRYGSGPLTIGRASVARGRAGAAVAAVEGPVPVPFGGQASVTIPPGVDVLSDPVPSPGADLAVSLYPTVVPARISSHPVAMRTSFLSGPGDATTSADGAGFTTTLASWPVLSGVEVYGAAPRSGIVLVGDSLVDGVGGTPDGEDRMSDALAARLAATGGDRVMTVLNAGLARNRLLSDDPSDGGASPVDRFDADVAGAAGARDVLLEIGTNDIEEGASADVITAGLARYADRARAAGFRVLLATVPPSTVGERGTPRGRAVRDAVNAWILGAGPTRADGVVDLAAAVADPADPSRLRPDLDSGDGLHPSPAGHRALAAAVDPAVLSGSACPVGTPVGAPIATTNG